MLKRYILLSNTFTGELKRHGIWEVYSVTLLHILVLLIALTILNIPKWLLVMVETKSDFNYHAVSKQLHAYINSYYSANNGPPYTSYFITIRIDKA